MPNFVQHRITPDRVLPETRLPAVTMFALHDGETSEDLATLVTAELDRIDHRDLERYQLDRAQFDAWREIQWPAGSALAPTKPAEPLPPLPLPPTIMAARVPALLSEIAQIVRRDVTPAQLPAYIAQNARSVLRGAETPDDWQTLLTAELDRFRVEECVTYKIRPEQYRAWRKAYWPSSR